MSSVSKPAYSVRNHGFNMTNFTYISKSAYYNDF